MEPLTTAEESGPKQQTGSEEERLRGASGLTYRLQRLVHGASHAVPVTCRFVFVPFFVDTFFSLFRSV